MGLQDRDYYPEFSNDYSWRGKTAPQYSISTILIFICVAVSVVDLVTSRKLSDDDELARRAKSSQATTSDVRRKNAMENPVMGNMALSTDPKELIWRPYTLLTYGFAHTPLNSSPVHLIFNMLGLYFIGNFCESFMGRKEFLLFYLASIIFAGAVYLLVGVVVKDFSTVVGASGALSACMIRAAWKFPHQRLLLMGVADVPLWGVGVGYVAIDMLGALSRRESGVAYTCHLGGALFATLYHHLRLNFDWLNFGRWPTRYRQRMTRRNLKVHTEQTDDEGDIRSLAAEADRLLDKIQQQGQASLTKRERDLLERYSREVQNKRRRHD